MNPAFPALIAALIAVESGGKDDAKGQAGESGCLQITQKVIDDVNKAQDTIYFIHASTLHRETSIAICKFYLGKYATAERLGHEPTLEDLARIWNGGPNGFKKASTVKYWAKVKVELERQPQEAAVAP